MVSGDGGVEIHLVNGDVISTSRAAHSASKSTVTKSDGSIIVIGADGEVQANLLDHTRIFIDSDGTGRIISDDDTQLITLFQDGSVWIDDERELRRIFAEEKK